MIPIISLNVALKILEGQTPKNQSLAEVAELIFHLHL